jgi:hypothetical protein
MGLAFRLSTRYLHHPRWPNSLSFACVDAGLDRPARKLTLCDPAVYRIRVQGVLEPSWTELMHGMTISVISSQDERHRELRETELLGRLADQAALIGVINTLYSLGLPLISVTCVWISEQ